MEQVQRHYVKFDPTTLEIISMGLHVSAESQYVILPVGWKLIEPFFNLEKLPSHYYVLIRHGEVVGFRRKSMFSYDIVKNSEEATVKSLRSFENFIADCRILVEQHDNTISLTYDPKYFDRITAQENLDRLTLVSNKVYNVYVTRRGDPFNIYSGCEITLSQFVTDDPTIVIPYTGPQDISVYAVAKD